MVWIQIHNKQKKYPREKFYLATKFPGYDLNNMPKVKEIFACPRWLSGKLPCTACRYCTTHCPKGLDIPALLELYNEHSFTGGGFIAPMALSAMPDFTAKLNG